MEFNGIQTYFAETYSITEFVCTCTELTIASWIFSSLLHILSLLVDVKSCIITHHPSDFSIHNYMGTLYKFRSGETCTTEVRYSNSRKLLDGAFKCSLLNYITQLFVDFFCVSLNSPGLCWPEFKSWSCCNIPVEMEWNQDSNFRRVWADWVVWWEKPREMLR